MPTDTGSDATDQPSAGIDLRIMATTDLHMHVLGYDYFANRPSASPAWRLVVLTDIAGGAEVCYSDGTDWRRCSDKTIASL